MKKDPCTKFYLITFLIMLQAILWFGLIAIVLTPTTVENYLFKIIIGAIFIILIVSAMYICELRSMRSKVKVKK